MRMNIEHIKAIAARLCKDELRLEREFQDNGTAYFVVVTGLWDVVAEGLNQDIVDVLNALPELLSYTEK